MTAKNFRRVQKMLDDKGILTYISRSGKNNSRLYSVIVNGELMKIYRQRISAKKIHNQTAMNKVDAIIEGVSRITGVSVQDMKSLSRKKPLVEARFIAFYLLKTNCPYLSLKSLSTLFGQTHCAALYGIKQCENYQKVDAEFNARFLLCKAHTSKNSY